jgi:hypothetical protein
MGRCHAGIGPDWGDLAAKAEIHGTRPGTFNDEASGSWGPETRITAMPNIPSSEALPQTTTAGKGSNSSELVTIPQAMC